MCCLELGSYLLALIPCPVCYNMPELDILHGLKYLLLKTARSHTVKGQPVPLIGKYSLFAHRIRSV